MNFRRSASIRSSWVEAGPWEGRGRRWVRHRDQLGLALRGGRPGSSIRGTARSHRRRMRAARNG